MSAVMEEVALDVLVDTTLGTVAEYITSGSRDWSKYYADTGAIFIRTQDINRNRLSLEAVAFVQLPERVEGKRSLVKKGDLLITITGANVGKVAAVDFEIPEAYVSQSVCLVRLKDPTLAKFIQLQLIASNGEKSALEAMAYGLGRPVLNLENIRSAPVKIGPSRVRDRIVAEIEKQFSRLDEAVANLKRVKANLKRYKASVLKDAVEGRLVPTEAELARREGRSFETGEQLLQRILETRRSQWKGRGKFKTLETPVGATAALPGGWSWSSIDQLAEVGTGATPNRSKAEYWDGGDVPWVTSGVVNADYVDTASEFVTQRALAETNLTLYPAGTLLVAMYGEGKTRGKCAELRTPATTNQALAALQVNLQVRGYVRNFLELNYEEMRKVASGGVQPNLNLSLVRSVAVPLPPLAEQARIVAEVDRRLSLVRGVEVEVDANLKRAAALRQATLKHAF